MRKKLKIIILLSFAAALLVLVMPRSANFSYQYAKGAVWTHETLKAPFDFPILKTNERLTRDREEAVMQVVPCFSVDVDAQRRGLRSLRALRFPDDSLLSDILIEEAEQVYARGVLAEDVYVPYLKGEAPEVILVRRGNKAEKLPRTELYTARSASDVLFDSVCARLPRIPADSMLVAAGYPSQLEPNLMYDQQTTAQAIEDALAGVPTTSGFIHSGQVVISTGDLITEELVQVLDSYKAEYENNVSYSGPLVWQWVGNSLIAVLLVVILFFAIYYTNPAVFSDSRFTYLLLVFVMTAILTLAVQQHYPRYIYAVPFTLAALYLQAFFSEKLIFAVYMVCLLPLLVFARSGVILFVIYLFAGAISLYSFRYYNRKWKQFLSALITFAALSLSYFGFWLSDLVDVPLWRVFAQFFVSSMAAVMFYPLIYLFEKIFNLVSNSRLRDLVDSSNPLLRRLEREAPGTFHHSVQVMNMAEAAARAIGANPLLVCAGAMFHDIGKMKNPGCFIENESLMHKEEGHRYHDALTPRQSSHDIIRHVADGVEIAREHSLPQVVIDFILTHHGTTVTRYFYSKYLAAGGDPSDREDFTYPGVPPKTKEQVILMLCDTVEAASRSLKASTPAEYSAFVEELVGEKSADGQFAQSEISIKDMDTVKEVIKSWLQHESHERVAYPKK